MYKRTKFRQIDDAKQLVFIIFLKNQSRRRQDMKTIITEVKKKEKNQKNLTTTCIIHGLYEEKSLIIDTR